MSNRCSACNSLQDVLDNHKVHISDANLTGSSRCSACGSLQDVLDNHKVKIEPLDDVHISTRCEKCGSLGDVLTNHSVRITCTDDPEDNNKLTLDDVLVRYHLKIVCC
jgi:arsenate reductase-like glutaredoxin family protein